MTKGTRTKALSRRTILKTVGAVGLAAAAGGACQPRVRASDRRARAQSSPRLGATSPHAIRRSASA